MFLYFSKKKSKKHENLESKLREILWKYVLFLFLSSLKRSSKETINRLYELLFNFKSFF